MTWFEEDLHTSTRQLIREDRLLFHGWTRYQEVRIFENDRLGKVLALDRVVQTTEADEFFYHEMMTHVPLVSHGAVEKVLIVGGADGGVLREVLRHPVSKVTIVDIDGELIDICRRHLPALSAGAFDDPRVEVIAADGAKYVSEADQLFDTIIIRFHGSRWAGHRPVLGGVPDCLSRPDVEPIIAGPPEWRPVFSAQAVH